MRRIGYFLGLNWLLLGSALAGQPAATLEVVNGPVYIDQGKGLVEAERFTLLNADDKVFLKAGSTALLVNNRQGCVTSLRDAGLYLVPDMSNCISGQASVLSANVTIQPANGVYSAQQNGQILVSGGGAASQSGLIAGLGFAAVVAGVSSYQMVFQASQETPPLSVSAY